MVAIVDDEAKRWVKIGSATAAGERRSLVHNDLDPGIGNAHSGAQARNARADDMDRASAHRMPYRRSAPRRRSRLALARRRGGAKPSFTILSRIEPYAAAINRGAFTAAIMDCAWSKCSRARPATKTQAWASFGSAAAASGSSVVTPAAASASRGRESRATL